DLIDIQIAQYDQHRYLAAKYRIEQVPAIVALPQDETQPDPGLRFYGLPSHYEFLTFLDVLSGLSRNEVDLHPSTLESLKKLEHNVHIKVFYTQNCALCPMVTHLAYQFALASDKVFTESLDASEFPQYAEFYNVRGVPYIIMNEKLRKVGVRSEEDFLKLIQESVSKPCPVMMSA
ncbi:MAG: thioredoxin family protein, partial [Bacteroidota bacterium]